MQNLSDELARDISNFLEIDANQHSLEQIGLKLFMRSMVMEKQRNWMISFQDFITPFLISVEEYVSIPYVSKHRRNWIGARRRQVRSLLARYNKEVDISQLNFSNYKS